VALFRANEETGFSQSWQKAKAFSEPEHAGSKILKISSQLPRYQKQLMLHKRGASRQAG
jgi:hypothetical protein